jgi:hypothetical protein
MTRIPVTASDHGTGVFMTDHDLPQASAADIARVHHALLAATLRIATPAAPPIYLRTIYLPSEQRCLSFFKAGDLDTIRVINDTAQFPDARIYEAVEYSAAATREEPGR